MDSILKKIKKQRPIIHCITNQVTINDCANAILAIGGSPIMAYDEQEVEDIVSMSQALVINIGTLNHHCIQSMIKAGQMANRLHIPVVLDPVGVGASSLRKKVLFDMLEQVHFDVIKGNVSEIKVIFNHRGFHGGVDVSQHDQINNDNLDQCIHMAQQLSQKLKGIIVITGVIDIVCQEKKVYIIKNGCSMMARITGTGCMLGAVIGTFVGCDCSIKSVAYASAMMGYCGELAHQKAKSQLSGTGSMRMYLIDYLSLLDDEQMKRGIHIEKR
jgi:hydroxyethylthiazole kinase